jgi:hypothetical protein
MRVIGVTQNPECAKCERLNLGGMKEGKGRRRVDPLGCAPETAVPAYALLLLDLKKLQTDRLFCSMICEKQFVPVDDQSLYCSQE